MSSVKFINEPVIEIDDNGNKIPFIPVGITNGRQAYAASLNIIFKHIAEFHITVLSIIAEKHGLNVDEILEEVHKDDRYIRMSGVIDNLGAFPVDADQDQEPAPVMQEPVPVVTEPTQTPAKKVVRKRKPTNVDPVEQELSESVSQMKIDEPPQEPDKPKKRVYKKKAATEA